MLANLNTSDGEIKPNYPSDEHAYLKRFRIWLDPKNCCEGEPDRSLDLQFPPTTEPCVFSANISGYQQTPCEPSNISQLPSTCLSSNMLIVNGVKLPTESRVSADCKSHWKLVDSVICHSSCSETTSPGGGASHSSFEADDEYCSLLSAGACSELLEQDHHYWCQETAAMHTEDLAAWWLRERTISRSKDQHQPQPLQLGYQAGEQPPEEDSRGRVILKASLSYLDNGVESLDHQHLELHLFERESDAAKHFLEQLNNLKPQRVCQYLGPLTSWLREQVQSAGNEIAGSAIHVEGDLEEIRLELKEKEKK